MVYMTFLQNNLQLQLCMQLLSAQLTTCIDFFAIIACDSIHMSAGHESNHETSHMINDVI